MSEPTTTSGTLDAAELEQAMEAFSSISDSLVSGYEALARRAEHVEQELFEANQELERKVRELDEVKRRLEAVLRALPTGVVVRDEQGRITRVNDAASRILGAAEVDLAGRPCHGLLEGEEADGLPRAVTTRDGRRLMLAARRSNVLDAEGRETGSVEILDDQTELTALGERVHAMDKMLALGTMTAGVAHEIRNPLNAVMGFAGLLVRELTADARAHRWASLIVEGCREADAIITNMLSLSSTERLDEDAIDGAELLEGAIRAARRPAPLAGAGADAWRIESTCSSPPFQGDRIKLRQAIRNLVANAIDALPEGGEIRVALTLEGSEIVARVADSGPGIPPALRSRVFDPFFTTRADGTGLGLALVATIAQLHGGSARVRSESGPLGGAELQIRIPYTPVP